MAAGARQVTRNPNGTTVNDALGVRPDAEYLTRAPAAVLDSVTYGRPIGGGRRS